jgi:hypothetical protein
MSCSVSVVWSHPVLSLCCTEHGMYHGVIQSDRITVVAMSRSGQLGQRCTVVACTSASALVTYEHASEIREPSGVPRAAKPFFIPMIHSPSGAKGHVTAPELPSQEGRAPSPGTRGSVGAHLSKEARSEAVGHMAAPELTTARR